MGDAINQVQSTYVKYSNYLTYFILNTRGKEPYFFIFIALHVILWVSRLLWHVGWYMFLQKINKKVGDKHHPF